MIHYFGTGQVVTVQYLLLDYTERRRRYNDGINVLLH